MTELLSDFLDANGIGGETEMQVDPIISLTRWSRGLQSTKGRRVTQRWSEFVTALRCEPPRVSLERLTWNESEAKWEKPKDDPGFSLATFRNDGPRKNDNVEQVFALVLDEDGESGMGVDDVAAVWSAFRGIVFTTFNNEARPDNSTSPAAPRTRAVLLYSRPVSAAEHTRIWTWARAHASERGLRLDDQPKDAARFWFDARLPANAPAFRALEIDGVPIDVDAILAVSPSSTIVERSEPVLATAYSRATSNEAPDLARISAATRRKRAAAYLAHAEAAVSGERGHDTAMRVATAVVRGFALDTADALDVLATWNARCSPRWSAAELAHKVDEAARVGEMPWGAKLLSASEERTAPASSTSTKNTLPSSVEWIGAAEIFAPLPPYPWLIPGLHIAPGRITLLSGFADVGKTVIAQSIALSVATGRGVWGVYGPARAGVVLHLNGEIGSYLARERYQRLARAMNVDPAELVASGALRLANYPDLRLDDANAEERLTEACRGCALVIIDSLRAFAGGLDENSKEIGVALLMLARVSEATGATVLVLHHNRKPQKDQMGGAKMAISGSGSIPGGAESIFVMSAEKGGPIIVEHERTPLGRKLDTFGLRIEDVEEQGNARWGLRVVHLEGEQLAKLDADAAASRAHADTERAASCIREAMARVGGVFKGSRDDLRIASGVGAVPFGRALSDFTSRGVIERRGKYHQPEWAWLGDRS